MIRIMMLKLSIYIKYNFPHIWECRYPPVLKGKPHSYKSENVDTSDIWIPLGDLRPNMGMLPISITFLGILKDYPIPTPPPLLKWFATKYENIMSFETLLGILKDYLYQMPCWKWL